MKLLILLSVVAVSSLMVRGAPTTTHQVTKASSSSTEQGPLSQALLSSSSSKHQQQSPSSAAASIEAHANLLPEDLNSRRPKMMNYFGYYPGYFGAGAPLGPQAAFMNAGYGPSPVSAAQAPSPYSPLNDFYQFPYGHIAPVYSYNGLMGGTGGGIGGTGIEGDDGYDTDEQQSTANDVDSNGGDDYEEDIFSRANRRRQGSKGNGNRNSPIFYIRLPPTPYMFIRGLGYISNPPTIQPLPTPVPSFNPYSNPYQNPYMQMPAANPYMQQPPNPFINVPVNYMSNAKPVGVYQYQAAGYQQPQTQTPTRFPINGYGPNQVTPIRQRPSFGHHQSSGLGGVGMSQGGGSNGIGNGYNPDSKITHLKGPFIFNGRPEDIYLLQNLQTTPYNANFFHGFY